MLLSGFVQYSSFLGVYGGYRGISRRTAWNAWILDHLAKRAWDGRSVFVSLKMHSTTCNVIMGVITSPPLKDQICARSRLSGWLVAGHSGWIIDSQIIRRNDQKLQKAKPDEVRSQAVLSIQGTEKTKYAVHVSPSELVLGIYLVQVAGHKITLLKRLNGHASLDWHKQPL